VRLDPQYYRPTEVDLLIGVPSKSKKLGWEPQYDLAGLLKKMVASDLKILKRGS
jgi:GDPmannose 4,6-dehydratase